MPKPIVFAIGWGLLCLAPAVLPAVTIPFKLPADASPRVQFGWERLVQTLQATGDVVRPVRDHERARIVLEISKDNDARLGPEGFQVHASPDQIRIRAEEDSGLLYGCLALERRISADAALPADWQFRDAPAFRLRGTCFGMQKPTVLPGRHVYEYPYTPELFPFFYDKDYWREYLDFLVDQRINTLYIWNGHPFASLVKLPDYPYAVEVPPEVFDRNVEMFRYITAEADRRGIWLVQMFYNIIVSQPFAAHHGIPTQLNESTPEVADYTRKSIAEFVHQFPNVGLLVCLGEACTDLDQQVKWCTDVILPGVKDGMQAAGLVEEPPIVIRAHATDAAVVMPAALQVYGNLYTMAKFNGESLTTFEPRGAWRDIHQRLSKLGSTHVVNVHILANLEPFRYGAPRFIQASVRAARDRLGARGLHVYPLAYWNWPAAPDKTPQPLRQIDRDWIWFEAWARYAWNPDVDPDADREYWIDRLATHYGNRQAAEQILNAYNDSGECAPMLVRRFGITEGNRQTFSLGMTLDQLVHPERYRPYPELWLSQAPPGERIGEYVEREARGALHHGETPVSVIRDVREYAGRAVRALAVAAPLVTKNRAEFDRLRNDVACIRAMVESYSAKVEAAMLVLACRQTFDAAKADEATQRLADSLNHFRQLAELTRDTYFFANSMQTDQRRIPVTGAIGSEPVHFHWTQLLDLYEDELHRFRQAVDEAKAGNTDALFHPPRKQLRGASVKVIGDQAHTYTVQPGTRVFSNKPWRIEALAPELEGKTGIRLPFVQSDRDDVPAIEFETEEAVLVLVGYVRSEDPEWLQAPRLEFDARGAERGGAEVFIRDAALVDTLPPIDVHAFRYEQGRHSLTMRGKGNFVVLGIVVADDGSRGTGKK